GDRAAHRDDERRHHRLRMAGLEAVQRTQQDRARDEQPGVAAGQQGLEVGHRYLVIALNWLIASRAPTPSTACSRQWSMWSCTSVFLALDTALSTACICWAISRQSRPSSSIVTTLRRWPSARFRR